MTETYQERIRRKLTAELEPIVLEIKDDSAKHAGHSGHNPLGETHFIVKVVSEKFNGQSQVARHRMVYQLLHNELSERVHALNIKAVTPAEHSTTG